jgi:hypothetical protein
MILPCGRYIVSVDGQTRACARPAEHLGICAGTALWLDLDELTPGISEEQLATLDADALVGVLQRILDEVSS